MLYKELKVGDTTYKLRLSTKQCVDVEKRLGGKSAMSVLMGMIPKGAKPGEEIDPTGVSLPLMGDVITIFHGSLQQFQHNIDLDMAYDIYDLYVDEGGSLFDFIDVLTGVLEVSGFLPKAAEEAATETPQKQQTLPEA